MFHMETLIIDWSSPLDIAMYIVSRVLMIYGLICFIKVVKRKWAAKEHQEDEQVP